MVYLVSALFSSGSKSRLNTLVDHCQFFIGVYFLYTIPK